MTKYQVKFSCGHIQEVQLFGKYEARNRKIAYYQKCGICSECYKKNLAEHIAKYIEKYQLPNLIGSAKQIAWAQKIRHKYLTFWEKIHEDAQSEGSPSADSIFDLIIKGIRSEKDSRFWIMHCDDKNGIDTAILRVVNMSKEAEAENAVG